MHSLATVHARDNQRRHDTAYLNKRLFTDAEKTRMIDWATVVKKTMTIY